MGLEHVLLLCHYTRSRKLKVKEEKPGESGPSLSLSLE